MVVRKTPKPAEPPATVPRGAHHRAQKFVSKNVTTPTAPARRRPHHPPRRQKSPTRPRHRPLVGTAADMALHWSTCSFRVVAGGNPNEQAPQRLGAGLPDPDRASAMNAARRPAQHIAWHRDLCPQGAHEHPRLSPAPGSAAPRSAGTVRTATSGHQRQKASGHIVVMRNSDATPVVPSKMSQRGDDTGRASHRGPPPAHLTRDPTT